MVRKNVLIYERDQSITTTFAQLR